MPTLLQQSIACLIKVFHKYSEKEGDKSTLNKSEVKELLEKELGEIFGYVKDPKELDRFMKSLDENGDGVVDFVEYMTLIATLTVLCDEAFKEGK